MEAYDKKVSRSDDRAAIRLPHDSIAHGVFLLSDREFEQAQAIIRDLTGISMSDAKRQLVSRRLSARLKATGMESLAQYLDLIGTGDPTEREAFSNAVTTNLTSFFREQHHFKFLTEHIVPELVSEKGQTTNRLRIWSAGCSTGEEPYSIAITLKEAIPNLDSWDAKLLCTDLDTDVLRVGKAGIYSQERVEKIPQVQLRRWFSKSRDREIGLVKVKQELRNLITFNQLNLMNDWPMRGPFDVIFCRNVVIYFDKPTQRVLIDRYANLLEDDGYLILGHSEGLYKVSDRFKLIGNTVYRKTH